LNGTITPEQEAEVNDFISRLMSFEERAELKQRLDTLHLRKIDLADEILVLNQDGYIGESTRREIDYAASLGKPVRFWYACPVCGSRYHPLEECDGPCDVDEIQE